MSLSLRPKFDVVVTMSADDAMTTLQQALSEGSGVQGNQFTLQYELRIPAQERSIWSPYLNLLVREEEDGTHLQGRFGPDVNIWTLFVALYAILGITGAVFGVVAHSQWSLNQSPTGLYYSGIALILLALVYAAGKIGEGLAGPHIERIRKFVAQAYGIDIDIES